MSEQAELFMFSLIMICHIYFGLTWIYLFLTELKQEIKNRFPKIYFSLFFCANKKGMQSNIAADNFK